MPYSPPHNIFPDVKRMTRLDGSPLEVASLVRQEAVSTCLVCGLVVVNPDWPTNEWAHAGQVELNRIATMQHQ
jgi:hypothetical protein